MKNFIQGLKNKYPYLYDTVDSIAREADNNGLKVYLVGGFVRDIIIGRENFDVDIVVEKEGIAFSRVLSEKFKATLKEYKPYGTATLLLRRNESKENVIKIDIATARREKYLRPGAMPSVEFSSLKDDLERRDFTVNAMAISMNPGNSGKTLDYFGGMGDIDKKLIRVLHDNSFLDDPTRVYRAVRFEASLDFNIETHTEALIIEAVNRNIFKTIEPYRVKKELDLILSAKKAASCLARMRKLNIPEKLKT